MEFEIVKLDEFDGNKASIYSVITEKSGNATLFDLFLEKFELKFPNEIEEILSTLVNINHKFGAREQFFKLDESEANFGDGVSALYDITFRNLRLYCIRYSNSTIILGGGGFKAKSIRRWQDSPALAKEARLMIAISKLMTERIINKEITYSKDGMRFEGDLIFNEL